MDKQCIFLHAKLCTLDWFNDEDFYLPITQRKTLKTTCPINDTTSRVRKTIRLIAIPLFLLKVESQNLLELSSLGSFNWKQSFCISLKGTEF